MKQAYRCYRAEGVTLDVIRPIRALDQKTAYTFLKAPTKDMFRCLVPGLEPVETFVIMMEFKCCINTLRPIF